MTAKSWKIDPGRKLIARGGTQNVPPSPEGEEGFFIRRIENEENHDHIPCQLKKASPGGGKYLKEKKATGENQG